MAQLFKFLSFIATAVVLLAVLAIVAVNTLVQQGDFSRLLVREVERRTGLHMRAGTAHLHLGMPWGVSVDDVALSTGPDTHPAVVAERILIHIGLLPLLHRKVVIGGIVLYGPEVRLSRSTFRQSSGPSPVEVLKTLASADFEEIQIERGEVLFSDEQKDGTPVETYFHEVSLTLRRVDAQEAAPLQLRPGATAYTYSAGATVKRHNSQAGFESEGAIAFPRGEIEFGRAWLDGRIALEPFQAILLHDYSPALKGVAGTVSSRFRWQGSLVDGVQIDGNVDFRGVKVDGADLFPRGVHLGNGRLKLGMKLSGADLRIQRFDLGSSGLRLSGEGAIRSVTGNDPYLELKFMTPFLPYSVLRRVLTPPFFQNPPWSDWLKGVQQGELKLTEARLSGRFSEMSNLTRGGFKERLWLRAEVRGVQWDPPWKAFMTVRGLSGRFSLEKGVLHFSRFNGKSGETQLQDVHGKVGVLQVKDPQPLEVRIRGESDVNQLWTQLKANFLPSRIARTARRAEAVRGKVKFVFDLRTDFKASPNYWGQMFFDRTAAVRVGEVSFTDIDGPVSFSPLEIRTSGLTFMADGSPLRVAGVLTDYQSGSPSLDLVLNSSGVKVGLLTSLLLSRGSPADPGTVRGQLRYQGSLGAEGKRQLTGTLDLAGVRLPLRLFKQPVRGISGTLKFHPNGVDLASFRGQVGGYGFDFAGRWNYDGKPQLTFTSSSVEMDFTDLLPRGPSEEKPSPEVDLFYNDLQVKGTIRVAHGRYKGLMFSDLETDLLLDRRRWLFDNFSAESEGGTIEGTGSFLDEAGAGNLAFSVAPRIRKVPVKGVLGFFGMGTEEVTGNVDLSGTFESSGSSGDERKQNLGGTFKLQVEDGVLRRMAVLVRVLSLMDLSRWFTLKMPDINREGIHFKKITGDFKVQSGVYSTQNLVVDGEQLRVSGAGEVDGVTGNMNLVIALRPFPKVDTAVNFIPILGKGVAGIKNSLLVASFSVKGQFNDPSITPAPISTLSEFFFGALSIPKEMLRLPGRRER